MRPIDKYVPKEIQNLFCSEDEDNVRLAYQLFPDANFLTAWNFVTGNRLKELNVPYSGDRSLPMDCWIMSSITTYAGTLDVYVEYARNKLKEYEDS